MSETIKLYEDMTKQELLAFIISLPNQNQALLEENKTLLEKITKLEIHIKELEARLNKNSKNSSTPPSAEGLRKPTRQQLRASSREDKASERKAGKQKGSKGYRLKPIEEPNQVIELYPNECSACKADFSELNQPSLNQPSLNQPSLNQPSLNQPSLNQSQLKHESLDQSWELRQVIDIGQPNVVATQYKALKKLCKCGTVTKAEFPPQANGFINYGPNLRAWVVYLCIFQLLPYNRASLLIKDSTGICISPGTIDAIVKQSSLALDSTIKAIRNKLRDEPVVHFDETGARTNGSLYWVHSASTDQLTYYLGHKNRGTKAIDIVGILNDFSGTAVHDGYRSYRCYEVIHSLCNAHHIRELQGVYEQYNQTWSLDLISLLKQAKAKVDEAKSNGEASLPLTVYQQLMDSYDDLINKGLELNPKIPDQRKQSSATNLILRLSQYKQDVMRFSDDFNVPFDNNQAERDIRMIKLKQKISGCWRTLQGLNNFLTIRAYISTAIKQKQDIFKVLTSIFQGELWIPAGV